MKYLVKVDYHCDTVKTGGQWFVIEAKTQPETGLIHSSQRLLEAHDCKLYYSRQSCDDDVLCRAEEIIDERPYSSEEATALGASEFGRLELICEEPARKPA